MDIDLSRMCGQEVWSEPWMGGGGQEWCQQMDKLQKLKPFHLITNIHLRAIFVLEKGGVLLLGSVLLLGHIRY